MIGITEAVAVSGNSFQPPNSAFSVQLLVKTDFQGVYNWC